MKRETKRRNNKGFSLVELIIVIAIMAILAGILAPQFIKYIKKSRVSTDIQNAQQIATAISAEYADASTERYAKMVELMREKMGFDSLKFQTLEELSLIHI